MNEQTQDLDKRLSRLENMHIMGGIIVAVGLFVISLSLIIAGIILENNLLIRTQFARFIYNSNNYS